MICWCCCGKGIGMIINCWVEHKMACDASTPNLWPSSAACRNLSERHTLPNMTNCEKTTTLSFFFLSCDKIPWAKQLKWKRVASAHDSQAITAGMPKMAGAQSMPVLCSHYWVHTVQDPSEDGARQQLTHFKKKNPSQACLRLTGLRCALESCLLRWFQTQSTTLTIL